MERLKSLNSFLYDMKMGKRYTKKLWKEGKKFREAVLLTVLKERPMTAYELAIFFTDKSSNNTIFVGMLKKLEEKGYLTCTKEGCMKPYQITGRGIMHLSEYEDTLSRFMKYLQS